MTGKVRTANDVIKELKGLVMMRKLASSFLLLVVAGCVLTGCVQSSLREAEAFLETDLKAADSILCGIPDLRSRRDRALYAVLKTQADYKQYKPLITDSLILTATRYYGTTIRGSRNRRYHSALAWYSQGCVYSELNNDLAAIDAYLKAQDLFPDTLVRYYALTEKSVGVLLLNRMMLDEARHQFKCCQINAQRLKDNKMQNHAIFHTGLCALYSKDFKVADSIFRVILDNSAYSRNQRSISAMQLAKINLYYHNNNIEALRLINRYLEMTKERDYGPGLSVKADVFYKINQFDSALYYYSESLTNCDDIYSKCSDADHLSELSAIKGNTDNAIHYHKLYAELRDSINQIERAREIEELKFRHNEELTQETIAHKHRRFTIISISALLSLALLLFLAYTLYKSREKKRIMERQLELQQEGEAIRKSTIELLESKIKDYSTQDPEARAVLLKSYSNRLQMCTNAFRSTPEYKMLSSYRLSVKELNRNDRDELFNQIKRSYLESITDIRIEIPDIGEKDILTVILRNQGLSIEQISALFSITTDSVKKRLYRLSQRASSDFLNIYGV
jgi:tetratricopeptide (TPR) repeat protein